MTAIAHRPLITIADYLAGEESADCRHDYLAGEVYAMSGASARHNIICGNLFAALHRKLAGGSCQVFMADLKVHLTMMGEDYFYYPDLMVACNPNDKASHYRDHPSVLVEVMSPTTERTDRREKLFAYREIASLEEYVLIAQDSQEVVVYRRQNAWVASRLGVDGVLELKSIDFALSVAELYVGAASTG